MASDDRIPSGQDLPLATQPVPPPLKLTSSDLDKVSEFLTDNNRITFLRLHYEKYRRYALLECSKMFSALVTLYAIFFKSQWPDFRRFHESMNVVTNDSGWSYAAKVYISTWFLDLYAYNREAVRKLSSLAFNQRFSTEIVPFSHEYDNYLSLLNASIRPTHIKLALEDALYIPLLTMNDFQAEDDNPFGITGFVRDSDYFYGFLDIMRNRKKWKMTSVSHDVLGRPCWLFDWFDEVTCCAWFPAEGNFNMNDVSLAYIVGAACTPKLAPRDVDAWQYFEGDIPAQMNPDLIARVDDRRFFGSFEMRTIEIDREFTIPVNAKEFPESTRKKKQKQKSTRATSAASAQIVAATEPTDAAGASSTEGPTIIAMPRYRVEDWVYNYRVVLQSDNHTRTGALQMLSLTHP